MTSSLVSTGWEHHQSLKNIFLKIIVVKTNAKKASSGIYISLENIISEIPGTFIFESIIFSNPLPIDEIKKTPGVIPKSVEKK